MMSFVLACTALALDMKLSTSEVPVLQELDDTFGKLKLPSEMKETDWVHFGNKMRLKLASSAGEGNGMYLHADDNGWLTIKAGAAGDNTVFEALSIFPSQPGGHGRLNFGQKFYLKARGTAFVHLGSATDVRVGDKFYATGLMDKTVFHMIDWPKAMSAQWGDSVKLATPRGQLLQCRGGRACVDVNHFRGGLHFVLESARPAAPTSKAAAVKAKAKKK